MNNLTLTFDGSGWESFWSYIPDDMIGINTNFYSFKGGNLFKHNENLSRNNFYGVNYPSKITFPFNDSILDNKLFKTISIEGNARWKALISSDIQTTGLIESAWFEKKEGAYFAFIRNSGTVPSDATEYPLRSLNGIGRSYYTTGTTSKTINFKISPLIAIGNIISVGDYLYYAEAPTFSEVKLAGKITAINQDYVAGSNNIVVDTTVSGATSTSAQDAFYFFIKNSIAESHGILGHCAVVTLENTDTSEVQLFAVNSEVMKSYP